MERIGFSFNPDSIAANVQGGTDVDVSSLIPGKDIGLDHMVLLYPSPSLHADLAYCGARITTTNNLRIYLANLTGSAKNDTANDWSGILLAPGDFNRITAAVDPGSIGANTRGSIDVSFSLNFDVVMDDAIIVAPPDNLETSLAYCGARMINTNTLRLYIMNVSEGSVDGAATPVWDFYILKNWKHDAFSWDPDSVSANAKATEVEAQTFQGQNIRFGDAIIMSPVDGLNTGLMYAGVELIRNNVFQMHLGNATTGALDSGAGIWDFFWRSF